LKFKRSKKSFLAVVVACVIFSIVVFDGQLLSILPLVATILSSYAFFFTEKIILRLFLIGTSLLRLFYAFSIGSIGGVINEIITQITLYITVYRFLA